MLRRGNARWSVLALALTAAGCARDPGRVALSLVAADAELSRRLRPAQDSWQREGDALTSPGWRSAHLGPFYDVAARLPLRADGALRAGIGQSELYGVTLTPVGARPVSIDERDGRAVYPQAYPSTDVVFVADKQRVEWFLLLADGDAPAEFAWRVALPSGLPQVKREPSGALVFADAGGTARLRVPRPYALDAHGIRRDADLDFSDGTLRVRLDKSGLTFPILLDPAIESAVWAQVAGTPSSRQEHAMAFDSARGRTVLFGGTNNVTYGDTWEWDGTLWSQRATGGPPARTWHALAYDGARGKTVLFGGAGTSGLLGDTWEWDGSSWTQRPVSGPSARSRHALSYDSARGRTVLFGGLDAGGAPSDTWEWDGTSWVKRATTGPLGRTLLALAFDGARQRTVLFGGFVCTSTCSYGNDTWEWDGSSWLQRSPVTSPMGRDGHSLAYDLVRGRTVMFGGFQGGGEFFNETWEWNGTNWTLTGTTGPSARFQHAMVYDGTRGKT